MKKGNRALAVLLSLVITLSYMPAMAFAGTEDGTDAGSNGNVESGLEVENEDQTSTTGGDTVNDVEESNVQEEQAETETPATQPEQNEEPALLGTESDDTEPVEDSAASIGDAKYATVAAALGAAKAGDKITLLKDVTENITVASGKEVVLDLNGHSLTNANGNHTVFVYGSLTVKDSSEGGKITSTNNCGICVSGGTLAFESGTVEAQEMALLVTEKGKATINGGSFSAKDNAVLGTNGSAGKGGSNITVNGGTFKGTITTAGYVACGIYAPNDDTWTLNGGSFNITNGAGIVARAGKINIPADSKVQFNTTGNATGKVGDSRVVVPCSAIVFDSQAAYPGLTEESALAVAGGTFKSEAVAVTAVTADGAADKTYVAVSGGSYSSQVPENCCAEGFVCEENEDGAYGIKEEVKYTAKFNAASYNLTAATYTTKATITREDGESLTAADKAGWTLVDESGVLEQSGATSFKSKTASLAVKRKEALNLASGSSTVALVKDGKTYATVTVNYSPSAAISTDVPSKMIEDGTENVTALKINGTEVDAKDYMITSDDESAATVEQNGSTVAITPLKAGKATFTVAKADDQSQSVKASITFKCYAAKIGDTNYETIANALKAANSGDTITLANDVTESVGFSGETPRADGFEVTIDLAGHTWTGATGKEYALLVEYGIVTVKDSSEGHTGGVKYGDDYAFIVSHLAGDYTSRLVLESGTFTGKTSVVQVGTAGGTGANRKYYGGELVVNGGTFKTVDDAGDERDAKGNFKYTLNKLDYSDSAFPGGKYSESKITVNGGTFEKFDPQNNVAEGEGTDVTSEGFVAIPDENGNYSVKEGYNVTFDANGGTPVPEAQRVEKGSKITKPEDPTSAEEDTVFNGWYVEGSEDAFDFDTVIASDTKLTANWKIVDESMKEADKKLEEAEQAVKDAETAAETAEASKKAADAAAKAPGQEAVNAAQRALNDANAAKKAADEALTKAKEAQEAIEAAYPNDEAKKADAASLVTAAQKAVTDAEKAAGTAQTSLNNAKSAAADAAIQGKYDPKLPKVKITKPAKKKAAITVKWKKLSKKNKKKCQGIEIWVAQDKQFKNARVIKTAKKTKKSLKVKKLARKKTYYVKVRSYKVVNGVKYVGAFSKIKKVKTK